ncbi:MAG: alpha-amylase family protein, partial [Verrucomicrobiota bacterium]
MGKKCWVFLLLLGASAGNLFAANSISAGTLDRQYKAVNTNFYNANCASVFDNMYDRAAMADPVLAEAYAKRLAGMGTDVVVLSGRHFRLNYPEEWRQIAQNAKIIADACHKHGIKVIEHHEITIPFVKANQFLLDHLDWMQQDVRTGEIWRWICPNNEEFIKFYSEYLQEFQRISGVDGYMLDELDMAGAAACGCNDCRRLYEEKLGEPMPYEIQEKTGAAQRNLARYKSHIKPRIKSRLLKAIREVNPQAVVLTYCSDHSDPRVAGRGINLANEAAYFSSFVGWEVMNADCFAGWRPWMRFGKMRASIGNYYGIPTWSLNREQRSKEGVYFAWALSQCLKNSIWFTDFIMRDPADADYYRKFLKWEHAMPFQHARCLTDTGFMLSNQTRFTDFTRGFFWLDAMGWADMLLEEDRQFDVVLDGDTENPGRLEKYNVLVLVGQAAMSGAQKENLAEWVAQGGNAIITTHTSLYDEYGEKRDDLLLSDLAGVGFEKQVAGSYTVDGGFAGGAFEGRGKLFSVKPGKDSKVLMTASAGGEKYPLVVETPHGKGRFIYVAAELGFGNAEMELRNNSVYRAVETPGDRKLVNHLVQYARTGREPIRFELPEGVQAIAHQIHEGERKGDIHVHLLNTTGKDIKPGDKRQFGVPEKMAFPAVKGSLKIFTYNVAGDAVARSPMMDGEVKLKPVAGKDGLSVITVPGKL